MSRIPEPESPFDEEGVPDLQDGLESKRITGDEQDGMSPPKDYSIGAEDYGTTAAEQAAGEPLSLRVERELPDVLAGVDEPADESEDADAPFPEARDEHVGRIVEPDEGAGPDTDADVVGRAVGADGGGLSAEERAMHVEPEA